MTDQAMQLFAHEEALRRLLRQLTGDRPSTRLGKALNLTSPGMLKEGMATPQVFKRFPGLQPRLEEGLVTDSVLLIVDLSPFSRAVSGWEPESIADFLNRYYRGVVDKVVQCGGVVEKYIGDAVIAAFGSPFDKQTTVQHLKNVVSLAMLLTEDIADRFEGGVAAKCAIAAGECFYGYVGHEQHKELTIVGNPLTELFRFEAVCPASAVILRKTLFDLVKDMFQVRDRRVWDMLNVDVDWALSEEAFDLAGIGTVEAKIIRRL